MLFKQRFPHIGDFRGCYQIATYQVGSTALPNVFSKKDLILELRYRDINF